MVLKQTATDVALALVHNERVAILVPHSQAAHWVTGEIMRAVPKGTEDLFTANRAQGRIRFAHGGQANIIINARRGDEAKLRGLSVDRAYVPMDMDVPDTLHLILITSGGSILRYEL